jgi:argininosuccinate lyase
MNPDLQPAPTFPAPDYAREVLEPAFTFAQRELFGPMMAANKAHAVMLIECGIVEPESGEKLLTGVLHAEAEGAGSFRYDPAVEDLFFAIERRIIELAGVDAGGNLQLGRSRNDLGTALGRMVLRRRLLEVADALCGLRRSVAALARAHVDTLMMGVTHTQEAQPTTLAHYLLGVLGPLERDGERFRTAYAHTNRSPLGVAAFTTSSLPVDRARLANLMAFDGIVENGYDAVGAADHMLEAVGALRTCCLSLNRFVNDLLIWARTDVGTAGIGNEFLQISSIMPQKRNPVVLEHIRARVGYVVGDATTVEAMVHGAAFGDTVDVEDEILVPLLRCCDHATGLLTLLTRVLATLEIDRNKLQSAARSGFGAGTELAERLVVDGGIPFRRAHQVVGRLVRELSVDGRDLTALTPEMVRRAALAEAGIDITMSSETLRTIADPAIFVDRRALPGGPARAAVDSALDRADDNLRGFSEWVDQRRAALTGAEDVLDRIAKQLARLT